TSVTNFSWSITTTGDYDGDGRTDLFWRNASTGANVIWKSASAANPQPVTSVSNQAWRPVK
ncbi:MAG TPA: FG-GAP repeat protein, partial [Lysobacter sp.]|nr:FG-GAP repeat protein [Lysobacter sp.]